MAEWHEIDLSNMTPEEALRRAQEEGYELSDAELDQIAGGSWSVKNATCPDCGSTNCVHTGASDNCRPNYCCNDCGKSFVM